MANNGFSVTYTITTPESAELGDFAESGFVIQSGSLRECIDAIGGLALEADSAPISRRNPPQWLTNYEYGTDYETGSDESRSLHFPDNVTDASRLRIARYLGIKVW